MDSLHAVTYDQSINEKLEIKLFIYLLIYFQIIIINIFNYSLNKLNKLYL